MRYQLQERNLTKLGGWRFESLRLSTLIKPLVRSAMRSIKGVQYGRGDQRVMNNKLLFYIFIHAITKSLPQLHYLKYEKSRCDFKIYIKLTLKIGFWLSLGGIVHSLLNCSARSRG